MAEGINPRNQSTLEASVWSQSGLCMHPFHHGTSLKDRLDTLCCLPLLLSRSSTTVAKIPHWAVLQMPLSCKPFCVHQRKSQARALSCYDRRVSDSPITSALHGHLMSRAPLHIVICIVHKNVCRVATRCFHERRDFWGRLTWLENHLSRRRQNPRFPLEFRQTPITVQPKFHRFLLGSHVPG